MAPVDVSAGASRCGEEGVKLERASMLVHNEADGRPLPVIPTLRRRPDLLIEIASSLNSLPIRLRPLTALHRPLRLSCRGLSP